MGQPLGSARQPAKLFQQVILAVFQNSIWNLPPDRGIPECLPIAALKHLTPNTERLPDALFIGDLIILPCLQRNTDHMESKFT